MFVLDKKEQTYIENQPYNEHQYSMIDHTFQQWKNAEPDLYRKFSSCLDDAVDYMSCFRADSIVKDAEKIKDALLLPMEPDQDGSEEVSSIPFLEIIIFLD